MQHLVSLPNRVSPKSLVTQPFLSACSLTFSVPAEQITALTQPASEPEIWDGFGMLNLSIFRSSHLAMPGWPTWVGAPSLLVVYGVFTRQYDSNFSSQRAYRVLKLEADRKRLVWPGHMTGAPQVSLLETHEASTSTGLVFEDKRSPRRLSLEFMHEDGELPEDSLFTNHWQAERFSLPVCNPQIFFGAQQELLLSSFKRCQSMELISLAKLQLSWMNQWRGKGGAPRLAAAYASFTARCGSGAAL
ncbi:MAG: hypothetical protein ACFCU3_09965 [Verrucomicrobiales bacterium]